MEKVQREHGWQGAKSIQDKRVGGMESGVREGREGEAGWMKGEVKLIWYIFWWRVLVLIDKGCIGWLWF